PPETSAALGAASTVPQTAVGGAAAAAAPTATAIAGSDRFETAVLVAQALFGPPQSVGVASGLSFPDGLAAGAQLGRGGVPLLLTPPSSAPASLLAYLRGDPA